MKISNSKKELARIISENGGWRDGAEFTAQDGDGTGSIDFFKSKPRYGKSDKFWSGEYDLGGRIKYADVTIKNFHQTILSSEEYFHLHPESNSDTNLTEEERCIQESFVPESKPTIEQLADDYRNSKEYADRKQAEADAAKADAEAKLAELVAAGKAIGLEVSVKEPELVITDWRDLMLGDLVELIIFQGGSAKVGEIGAISKVFGNGDFHVDFPSQSGYSVDHSHIKFIRRT